MSVQDAIRVAVDEVKKLFGGEDHRLEEVEFRETGDFNVTVSYRSADSPRPITLGRDSFLENLHSKRTVIGIDATRAYKDVLVSKEGQVKGISMRQIVVG